MAAAGGVSADERDAIYRDLQRVVPGMDTLYRRVAALAVQHSRRDGRLLVVGAGGGRELAALAGCGGDRQITALDPSQANLEHARRVATQAGLGDGVAFRRGPVESFVSDCRFDVAMSLLVMHHITDDGAKLRYLTSIRRVLGDDGLLIHADICCDAPTDRDRQIARFLAHAQDTGIRQEAIAIELDALDRLPVVSDSRVRELFREAGFARARRLFHSLWYRCWTVGAAATPAR